MKLFSVIKKKEKKNLYILFFNFVKLVFFRLIIRIDSGSLVFFINVLIVVGMFVGVLVCLFYVFFDIIII